ncbi:MULTISPECIES: 3-oxoadipyl-CoA thiolase [Chryseobacterium]|uniref:Beta-ketoadipyl-CoA thiolase n=1 Tax=Chryseobacterium camelliae TaxID=1265445 RepID=A0ABU0TP43_9FLAO|nr:MULTISPECIES: 3-oxoadipyl-CoA thiolase [Chryseobacterium]MDT3407400.1 acetyl-CoA acyltransferase [Pseudacidovorax intermedius]MDQ1098751.1 acetyl-CoA acyltransferase [Chryseobacterium camelliae]MDQ1102675.1 acetyl-CoA acyltransferase [Chryseobacterium sp. SORGH_AS_1048]MDR6086103.1 acetyl-CoA acyltransferase [Chryseobacterium sp. SORGH_AS_0909]MDR6130473.1 acetyl-CoA acyltransferase [Chryseobacterium sp. SORGH_AS_1175]
MNNVYIIDYIRTPISKLSGGLSEVRADDLAAIVIKEIIARNPEVPVEEIEDVIFGCANQAGEDNRNVARMALLLAGLPYKIGGETVNRLCASGMSAVANAFRAIAAGEGEIYIAGGVEHMTRSPYVMSKPSTAFGRDSQMFDTTFGWRFVNPKMKEMYGVDGMGETAENLADMHQISREDQDQFALWSQQKASKAQENGRLAEEIVQVEIPQKKGEPKVFDKDEFIKPTSTMEGLAKLRPAFRKEGGTVTAGNASGMNDGAAALILASEEAVQKYGLQPIAKILGSAVAGVEPRIMGIGPVEAAQKVLKRLNLSLDDMDVIELNEAFAAQALAVTRSLGLKDDDSRVNPNGGAIAIGHPLGVSGARIIGSAAMELQKQNKKYALCTLCIGVGQGYAMVIEKV